MLNINLFIVCYYTKTITMHFFVVVASLSFIERTSFVDACTRGGSALIYALTVA